MLGGFMLILLARAESSAGECAKAETQREIEACLQDALAKASKEVDDAYNRYLVSLPKEQRSLLKRAQDAWVHYRDANCKASAAVYSGGTMAPAELAGCKLDHTRDRLAELRRIYEEPPSPKR